MLQYHACLCRQVNLAYIYDCQRIWQLIVELGLGWSTIKPPKQKPVQKNTFFSNLNASPSFLHSIFANGNDLDKLNQGWEKIIRANPSEQILVCPDSSRPKHLGKDCTFLKKWWISPSVNVTKLKRKSLTLNVILNIWFNLIPANSTMRCITEQHKCPWPMQCDSLHLLDSSPWIVRGLT